MATNIKRIIYFHYRLDATAMAVKNKRSDIDMFRRDFGGPAADNWADMSRAHGYHACARTEMREPWFPDAKLFARAPNLLAVCSLGAGYDVIDVEACTKAGFDNLLGLTPNDKLAATVDADGYVSPNGFQFNLNYEAIIPLLTKAMQNIKASMDHDHARTEDEVAKLKAANDNLAAQLKTANDNHLHDAEAIEELREAVMKLKRPR
jgi:hypothetical protein